MEFISNLAAQILGGIAVAIVIGYFASKKTATRTPATPAQTVILLETKEEKTPVSQPEAQKVSEIFISSFKKPKAAYGDTCHWAFVEPEDPSVIKMSYHPYFGLQVCTLVTGQAYLALMLIPENMRTLAKGKAMLTFSYKSSQVADISVKIFSWEKCLLEYALIDLNKGYAEKVEVPLFEVAINSVSQINICPKDPGEFYLTDMKIVVR